jgi:hypothetical protein
MPSKIPSDLLMPHLNPKFVPDHPENHVPSFEMDPDEYWGEPHQRTERERKKLQKKWLEKAMEEWNPPHVVRAWETDMVVADRRQGILRLVLSPRVIHPYERLAEYNENSMKSALSKEISELQSLDNLDLEEGKRNFRRFANKTLHLGYHRIHASHGEPHLPSEEISMQQYGPDDPHHAEFPPEDICWIAEYTENECHITRRKIARLMGLYPAAMEEGNPGYDYDQEGIWMRKVYARCRRRNKKCIRPSHIVMFGSNFKDLP